MQFEGICLGGGVTTVNTELSASDILGGITKQEGDSTHEVLGGSHFADGDQRSPLLVKLWVLVKNLASQSREHVTRADTVNSDVMGGPFNSEGRSQVSHSGLGGVVWSLGLGNVNNGTRHAANHDNAA